MASHAFLQYLRLSQGPVKNLAVKNCRDSFDWIWRCGVNLIDSKPQGVPLRSEWIVYIDASCGTDSLDVVVTQKQRHENREHNQEHEIMRLWDHCFN